MADLGSFRALSRRPDGSWAARERRAAVERAGRWVSGRLLPPDPRARPPYKDSYDVHFGGSVAFALADGRTATRRDHDFEIAVRRKDLRARGG